MEIADVRRRLHEAIERAKRRRGLDRRTRTDEARHAFDVFLERTAVPLFRQAANVLRADGYPFTLHTPADRVRLISDRRAEDYVEIVLDTEGDAPQVLGRTSRSRAAGVVIDERALGDASMLAEEELLAFLVRALEPFVER